MLQPVPASSPPQYAPLSNCTWVVQPAGMPYVRLSFSYFSTEPLYDTLLVEDADGVLAVVSGDGGAADLPGPFSTDTGKQALSTRITIRPALQPVLAYPQQN